MPGDEISYEEALSFQLLLYRLMIDHRLQADLDSVRREALLEHRRTIEERRWQLEGSFVHRELSVRQFVDAFNELTIALQDGSAEILSEAEYRALYDASRDERWLVGDPVIAEAAYPDR